MEQLEKIWEIISQPLFKLGENEISLASVLTAGFILLLASQAAKYAEKLMHRVLQNKGIDPGVAGSLERFTRYLVLALGFFITLDTLGISLTSLAAVGAVLMVGIGFGLQNITQNFISGIILLLERPIKKSDIIRVGNVTGQVVDIRARSTLIKTRDDIAILVPNSSLISEQVVNESFLGEKIRLHINVGVAYGTDVEKVRDILLKIASQNDLVLQSPPPSVIFKDFGESSLDFALRIWTRSLWACDDLQSDIRFSIDREFRAQNVEIPFPQRDLHLRSGWPEQSHT